MTKEELYAFICDDAGLERSDIGDETLLFSDGFIDSFTMTSLLAFVEGETDISIDQAAVTLENFDTVPRILAFVESQNAP